MPINEATVFSAEGSLDNLRLVRWQSDSGQRINTGMRRIMTELLIFELFEQNPQVKWESVRLVGPFFVLMASSELDKHKVAGIVTTKNGGIIARAFYKPDVLNYITGEDINGVINQLAKKGYRVQNTHQFDDHITYVFEEVS